MDDDVVTSQFSQDLSGELQDEEEQESRDDDEKGVKRIEVAVELEGGSEFALEEGVDTEQTEHKSEELLNVRTPDSCSKPRKYAFKLEHSENGNILTVHHTVQRENCMVRIRFAVCCFNEQGTQLVAIDKRGNVFVFDFVRKRYCRLNVLLPKASVIRASLQHNNDYIVGNKLGQLFIVDVENSVVVKSAQIAVDAIEEISFGPKTTKRLNTLQALLRFGYEAQLLKLDSFLPTHRLEFDQVRFALKFASYMPHSEQILTCFTNDSVHLWSALTLNTLRVVYPIKMRDRKLRLMPASANVPEISLRELDDEGELDDIDQFELNCQEQDYADGCLLSYCFTPDGNKFCLTTLDGYLMLLSSHTFDLDRLFRLRDFVLKRVVFLPLPKERMLFGLTTRGKVIMLDLANPDFKLIIQPTDAVSLSLTPDGKLLAVLCQHGEVHIWSTCRLYNKHEAQVNCMALVRSACKQKKPLPFTAHSPNDCLNQDLRKLLKRDRLMGIIMEFGSYPEKYRHLIWTALLELPCNGRQFQQLLKLGVPIAVSQRSHNLRIKNDGLKRTLVKVWSCLAHWCKVFAYANFMPFLIFPFVKLFPKNSLICFELMVTLLLNHFHNWFEFHPLEPANYLGMCENLLQSQDEKLCKYFAMLGVTSTHFAWTLLANAFSEVLDEEQWLILWDNVISETSDFLIFVVVAYNLLQREVILRLPDKPAVLLFYRDKNPIDIIRLLHKARKLRLKVPSALHPQRYMPHFVAIPKNVYPKFLNYPHKWIDQQEDQSAALQQQQLEIDARIRVLELEEIKMTQRLQEGLKREEHERRIQAMEQRYQDALSQEEQRVACHRKMLLLYQKEIRTRKGEVLRELKESEQRRKTLAMEKDIGMLMHHIEHERKRNNQQVQLAEEEIRNQELELIAQKYADKLHSAGSQPLAQKFRENAKKLCAERQLLDNTLCQLSLEKILPVDSSETPFSRQITEIDQSITQIQKDFIEIMRK